MRYLFDDGPAGATFHFHLDARPRLPVRLQFSDGVVVVEGADLHDPDAYPIMTAGVDGGAEAARQCRWLPLLGVPVAELGAGSLEQEREGVLEVDSRLLAALASAVQARYAGTPFHWPFPDIPTPQVVGAHQGSGVSVPSSGETPEQWCYPPTAPSGIDVSRRPAMAASPGGIQITVPGTPPEDGPEVAAMLLFDADDGTPLLYASGVLEPDAAGWHGIVDADCDPADVCLEIVDTAIGYGADSETRQASWAALRQFAAHVWSIHLPEDSAATLAVTVDNLAAESVTIDPTAPDRDAYPPQLGPDQREALRRLALVELRVSWSQDVPTAAGSVDRMMAWLDAGDPAGALAACTDDAVAWLRDTAGLVADEAQHPTWFVRALAQACRACAPLAAAPDREGLRAAAERLEPASGIDEEWETVTQQPSTAGLVQSGQALIAGPSTVRSAFDAWTSRRSSVLRVWVGAGPDRPLLAEYAAAAYL